MKLKWKIEVEVDSTWVEDGFDITDDRINQLLQMALPYAHGSEVSGKVIEAPDKSVIRKLQGYKD